jgi:transcriptional regulator with XRE-family HTH domain
MNLLKKFRVKAEMTQAKLAAAVGVTQPNYQRWEAGNAPIPDEKLAKLAKVLKATPETLLGRYAPITAAFYDDSAPEHLQYYGEVAVHFTGGGQPLLLSISEETHSNLFRELQDSQKFVTVKSLANQTVVVRTAAISDVYFSSEAYDDFGPEHDTYEHVTLQLPDPRDWEIVEAMETGDVNDFDPAAVERIKKILETTTDEEFKELVDEGHIKPEDVDAARSDEKAAVRRLFELARDVVYQLSTGQKRHISVYDDGGVYGAFWEIVGNYDGDDERIIVFQAEGYHRTAFINKNALDYVSIPTHKYEAGELESNAEEIEFFGDDDPEPPKSKSKGRSKKAENVVEISSHRK